MSYAQVPQHSRIRGVSLSLHVKSWSTARPLKFGRTSGVYLIVCIRGYDRTACPFPHPFWADAICIDQQNVSERDAQVRIMGRIFSTAAHTLVWLANLDEELTQVLRTIMEQGDDSLAMKERVGLWQQTEDNYITSLKLANNPYWTRLWVVQRIFLPKTSSSVPMKVSSSTKSRSSNFSTSTSSTSPLRRQNQALYCAGCET